MLSEGVAVGTGGSGFSVAVAVGEGGGWPVSATVEEAATVGGVAVRVGRRNAEPDWQAGANSRDPITATIAAYWRRRMGFRFATGLGINGRLALSMCQTRREPAALNEILGASPRHAF